MRKRFDDPVFSGKESRSVKAVCLRAPQEFVPVEIPEPAAPGPGQVLVRTHRMGVCGTDLSAYLGKMPFFAYPRIPGHELGVEVLAVGPDVTKIRPGDRCSVEPYLNCGTCLACRKGATNCCASLKVIGVMQDGGLCERFLIRAEKLHPSAHLSYDELALVETLAIGRHAVQRADVRAGQHVLVIGAGPIGLSVLVFLKLAGVRTIVLDLHESRLAFCRERMQVDATLNAAGDFEPALRDLTRGDLPEVVIDATGSPQSMSRAFSLIAPTGRLVFVGITPEEVHFQHTIFHKPEGTLLCSRNALPSDFTEIIEAIERGRIDTKPWITHRTSLANMIEDFPAYTRPETGVVKAIIEVS